MLGQMSGNPPSPSAYLLSEIHNVEHARKRRTCTNMSWEPNEVLCREVEPNGELKAEVQSVDSHEVH